VRIPFKKFLGRFGRKKKGALAALERKIGYRFSDIARLKHALTHRSSALSSGNNPLLSNERLEFLGDALLGFVVGENLYHEFPDRLEGELSRLRSLLISRKALKTAADNIGLSDFLLLSHSEEKTGGRTRFSINTNAFEALVAAIYLDGGFKPARRFIEKHVLTLLPTVTENELYFNYKSKLLEQVQAQGDEAPRYSVESERGPDHNKIFQVAVSFWGKTYGRGEGKNKKDAEQAAARAALEAMEEPTP
jgi:ribonuclease-3